MLIAPITLVGVLFAYLIAQFSPAFLSTRSERAPSEKEARITCERLASNEIGALQEAGTRRKCTLATSSALHWRRGSSCFVRERVCCSWSESVRVCECVSELRVPVCRL